MLYVTNMYAIYLFVIMRITTETMYNLFIYNVQFKEPRAKNAELIKPQTFQTSNSSNAERRTPNLLNLKLQTSNI
jgi:hypothetical protein